MLLARPGMDRKEQQMRASDLWAESDPNGDAGIVVSAWGYISKTSTAPYLTPISAVCHHEWYAFTSISGLLASH